MPADILPGFRYGGDVMRNEYTSTTNYRERNFSIDDLTRMWEELKPDLYYRTSEFVPKVDADGNPFCVCIPDFRLGFDDRPVALRDVETAYIHPDNLPAFLHMAKQKGLRVAPKDNS